MSPPDGPLWARAVAGVLLIVGSWWLVQTDAVVGAVGYSVAPLSVGVMAAFIIRGLGLPLGLWPRGPERAKSVPVFVLTPAILFAVLVLLAVPSRSAPLLAIVDVGTYALVMAGVVALGLNIALVEQRGLLVWFGAGAVAAALPYIIVGVRLAATGGAQVCLFSATAGGPCEFAAVPAIAFLVPVGTAVGVVTNELAFRRLLLGYGERPGLLLVVGAALSAAAWAWVVGRSLPVVGEHWWVMALSSLGAGSLYALSGSVAVSALYSAMALAVHTAVAGAGPAGVDALAPGGLAMWLQVLVAATLLALTLRRHGLMAPLR